MKLVNGAALALLCLSACSDKKDNKPKGGPNNCGPQGCGPNGPMGSTGLAVTANLTGALGLLVVDEGASGMGLALTAHNETRERLGLWQEPKFDLSDAASFSLNEGGDSTDGGLKKVDSTGEVGSALSVPPSDPTKNFGGPQQQLPGIRTIAVSPQGEIYLHFERAFQYRDAPANVNAWEQKNGYQCQIFKVKGGTFTDLLTKQPEPNNLECLDNVHFINDWQAGRNSVFQFDQAGNVYYPGSTPESGGKMVVYKRSPDGNISEVINANINVQDFLITNGGGVFYTGNTNSGKNGGGGSGGFFRYISAGNNVIEIARNWWNFIFEPMAGLTGDKALFFGPDPRQATTASWNTACLFEFNPGAAINERTKELITCGSDIWGWVEMRDKDQNTFPRKDSSNEELVAWRTEAKQRCESENDVFAGGGSQISAIKQSSTAKYVVGNVRKKKKGTYGCQLTIKGEHCVIDRVPYIDAAHDTFDECTAPAVGGTWVSKGTCNLRGNNQWFGNLSEITSETDCIAKHGTPVPGGGANYDWAEWNFDQTDYDNVASPLCTVDFLKSGSNVNLATSTRVDRIWEKQFHTVKNGGNPVTTEIMVNGGSPTTRAGGASKAIFSTGWSSCQSPASTSGGDSWSDEQSALARVKENTKSLELLSHKNEQVINLFLVNDEVFYSLYDVAVGRYQLRKYVPCTSSCSTYRNPVVLDNFEVYQVGESPQAGKAFFNGLNFASNTYEFGTLDTTPDSNGNFAKATKTGVTGTVRTIIKLSN